MRMVFAWAEWEKADDAIDTLGRGFADVLPGTRGSLSSLAIYFEDPDSPGYLTRSCCLDARKRGKFGPGILLPEM
jgi:hypothetical protein